jgi:hypothetical protein
MRSIWNQAIGREPESFWMSMLGVVGAFAIPVAFAFVAVAFGWGRP